MAAAMANNGLKQEDIEEEKSANEHDEPMVTNGAKEDNVDKENHVDKEKNGDDSHRRRRRKKHHHHDKEEKEENGDDHSKHHRRHHKKTRHIERMEEVWKSKERASKREKSGRSKKIHVRSKDPLKIARQLERNLMEEQRTEKKHGNASKRMVPPPQQIERTCKICGKEPYLVERLVAEKRWWCKNCFRCSVCNKILALDTYMSHEGVLYCKAHHRELLQPKVVKEDLIEAKSENKKSGKKKLEPEIIENEPVAPDETIVRSDASAKYEGLENLDVGAKFDMFEKANNGSNGNSGGGSDRYGIMEKLRRLQEGADLDELMAEMDAAMPDQAEATEPASETTSASDKTLDESNARRARLAAERKAELQEMRERMMSGTREAVLEQFGDLLNASANRIAKTKVDVKSDNAKRYRELFNKGEVPVVEAANAINGGLNSSDRIILEKELELQQMRKQKRKQKEFFQRMEKRGSEEAGDSELPELASLSNRFSFFENYTPPDPKSGRKADVAHQVEDGDGARDVDTARKECKARSVLSKFKEMEQKAMQGEMEEQDSGPVGFDRPALSVLGFIGRLDGAERRPLKRFTPPRKLGAGSGSEEYSDSDSYTDSEDYSDSEDYTSSSYTDSDSDSEEDVDETLRAMKAAARAKALKAKFEEWEASQEAREQQATVADENGACLDTASALKAKFEALKMIDDLEKKSKDEAFRPKRFK